MEASSIRNETDVTVLRSIGNRADCLSKAYSKDYRYQGVVAFMNEEQMKLFNGLMDISGACYHKAQVFHWQSELINSPSHKYKTQLEAYKKDSEKFYLEAIEAIEAYEAAASENVKEFLDRVEAVLS